ncbi:GAF domain-containing protein [Fangia hongkongensis]|uniref:GAF domain-containing protein n=1 Tax=Fangia hongkongensis TaxID=270495 RepID=UPI00037F7C58|nr:GAF domain-containing protein [Fangia hongkongensis]MBK2126265.1 GAF domain-containing protein [Fangia hongkongensis]
MSRVYSTEKKHSIYQALLQNVPLILDQEKDLISIMSTVCCELKAAFSYFDWVGFYRHSGNSLLKVGPYQGGHGCLSIQFDRGVCGKAASERKTQIVDDVNLLPYHIACSSSTVSEIVVPWVVGNRLIAVLDIDSDDKACFDQLDKEYLERLLSILGDAINDE